MKVLPRQRSSRPGSYPDGCGGNEAFEARETEGGERPSASWQVVTRVNAEAAPKVTMRRPILPGLGEGWYESDEVGRQSDSLRRGGGRQHVNKEQRATREAPTVRGRGSQPELREEQAGPFGVADRFVLLMKPGNAGGGKEPDFWRVTGRDQESGDWLCL